MTTQNPKTSQPADTSLSQISVDKLQATIARLTEEIELVQKQQQEQDTNHKASLNQVGEKVAKATKDYTPSGLGISYSETFLEDFLVELNFQTITEILQEMFKVDS